MAIRCVAILIQCLRITVDIHCAMDSAAIFFKTLYGPKELVLMQAVEGETYLGSNFPAALQAYTAHLKGGSHCANLKCLVLRAAGRACWYLNLDCVKAQDHYLSNIDTIIINFTVLQGTNSSGTNSSLCQCFSQASTGC